MSPKIYLIKGVLVLTLFFPVLTWGSLTCLSCKDAVLPVYCDTIVRCGQHESCFTDTFVTSSGFVRYDLGCRDTLQCRGSNNSFKIGRSSSSDSLIGSACCNDNLCNARTKHHPGYSEPRGPICFNCKSQAHYDDCNKITVCSQDELCVLRREDGHLALFQTSCERMEMCQRMAIVMGKRNVDLHKRDISCSQCCSTDLCNDRCNISAVISSPCAARPCLGGKCRENWTGYVCDCDPGYAGVNCEKVVQRDPCLSNPCVFGECINHGSYYACRCKMGYTGSNCDKAHIVRPQLIPTSVVHAVPTSAKPPQKTGCSYQGHIYAQGQTWKSGCRSKCACYDGKSGRYHCIPLCFRWNLPYMCRWRPPRHGKCCPTPDCPPGFHLRYPPGYTED